MPSTNATWPSRVLAFLAAALVVKVTASVVLGYRDYLPPNFEADFLRGRETYFWGTYGWAFFAHLASGPTSLLLGTLLVSERFRRWTPRWHRRLGKLQVAIILLLVAPSGLWMAWYAMTGLVAGLGLGSLAIATAACVLFGWRAAVQRRFAIHERWMWRTYLLLVSAVVIRLIGGLADFVGLSELWLYPLSCWASWLVPLLVYELLLLHRTASLHVQRERRHRRRLGFRRSIRRVAAWGGGGRVRRGLNRTRALFKALTTQSPDHWSGCSGDGDDRVGVTKVGASDQPAAWCAETLPEPQSPAGPAGPTNNGDACPRRHANPPDHWSGLW